MGQYLNLADSVQYMGMQTCQSCHSNVHQTFIETGMVRSFDHATTTKSDAKFGDHALVYDKRSNFYYKPYFENGEMFVKEFRLSGKDTSHQRTEKINYIIGSGQHTNSHIIDKNGYIFQAPITYYTQDGKWDMAPGFEKENLRFSRVLTSECITCHNHLPEPVEQSLNKFAHMPSGIECERCHGPGEIHVKEKLAGNIVDTSQYIDYTIVNPRDLPVDLQMDLCQRCHLQGVAVLEEGKTFYDFKPGMKLSEVMNVYLPRYTNSHEKFIMASQADRLRLSKCYINSGKLTCLNCHHPHHSIEVTSDDQYNEACNNCHQNNLQKCSAPPAEIAAENGNCVSCHMPPSSSIDIPHISITDHYISKTNIKNQDIVSEKEKNEIAAFLGLEILTKDKATALDLAKGYIALYDKYVQSPVMLDSAFYYLNKSSTPIAQKIKTLVHYYFSAEKYEAITQTVAENPTIEITDSWTSYRIGEAFFKQGKVKESVNYYQKAVAEQKYNLDFHEKLGVALANAQDLQKAKATLEFVLAENPDRIVALSNLGYIYILENKIEKGEALYDKAIALNPDYERALLNKGALHLMRKDIAATQQIMDRILKINPNNQQALAVLQHLKTLK